MMMTEKFKILAQFVKDMSSETPNTETYLYVKENISKYNLNIDINSKALKIKLLKLIQLLNMRTKNKVKKNHILR